MLSVWTEARAGSKGIGFPLGLIRRENICRQVHLTLRLLMHTEVHKKRAFSISLPVLCWFNRISFCKYHDTKDIV